MFHVLLYYKIVPIQHPNRLVVVHKEVCKALNLTGRILIGKDGINGTVGGSKESIDLYIAYCNKHPLLKHIDFKKSTSEILPFPKLKVKEREEIITTDVRDNFDLKKRGNHINRDTFHEWLVRGEDMIILDMRNDYEWEIGRFKNSVRPPMKYFRDLKNNMAFYAQFKEKKVVMFCTGGIRCEPASALFLQHGFAKENIYQLEGGIVKYAEKYGDDGFYEGKCFVFDDRMAIFVGSDEIVGQCVHCQQSNDSYRNCANKYCNKLFLGCDNCSEDMHNTCSHDCLQMISDESARRPVAANHVFKHRNK